MANDLIVQSSLQNIPLKVDKQQDVAQKTELDEASNPSTVLSKGASGLNQESEQEANKSVLEEKVAQLNDHMQHLNRNLQFSVDETSGDTVVKVIDAETKELVRQIPSQDVIDARNAVAEYRGLLLETKV